MRIADPGLIFAVRRVEAPELDVFHEDAEVRSPSLRLSVRTGRNVATDYALIDRAVPFNHRMSRPQISVLIDGVGRADEAGHRTWIAAGDVVVSDGGATRGGILAYAGATTRQVLLEWDPQVFGAPVDHDLRTFALSVRDRHRLEEAAVRAVHGKGSRGGVVEVLEILRVAGVPFHARSGDEVPATRAEDDLADLYAAMARYLSTLESYPTVEELAASLGWNARRLHRRVTDLTTRYSVPWPQWRWALHAQRIMTATRLLASPRATTENVARRTGFRAPAALCHAFADAGLPSPGALAAAARSNPLDAWTTFARTHERRT